MIFTACEDSSKGKQTFEEGTQTLKKGFGEKAMMLYQKSCDQGYGKACAELGVFYFSGLPPVSKDLKKAKELLEKSCEYEDMQGCYILGSMYRFSQIGFEDYLQAFKLFKKACDGGYNGGCYSCAVAYASGQGVEKNLKKAKKYFSIACDNGHSEACHEQIRLK